MEHRTEPRRNVSLVVTINGMDNAGQSFTQNLWSPAGLAIEARCCQGLLVLCDQATLSGLNMEAESFVSK